MRDLKDYTRDVISDAKAVRQEALEIAIANPGIQIFIIDKYIRESQAHIGVASDYDNDRCKTIFSQQDMCIRFKNGGKRFNGHIGGSVIRFRHLENDYGIECLTGAEMHLTYMFDYDDYTKLEQDYLSMRMRLGPWQPIGKPKYALPMQIHVTIKLTDLEKSKKETRAHIHKVQQYTLKMAGEITHRGYNHDKSKLEEPEVSTFAEMTGKLKTSTYGSEEYKGFLKQMKPALDHHYAHNPHHPEAHKNGIDGMTLVDLVEMICDWRAAVDRHDNGDIMKSIEINTKRFNISPQLKQILINTVEKEIL